MKAEEILELNYNCKEGSFIYFLHEEARFEKESFWDYYNSLVSLAQEVINNDINREIAKMISYTYSFILKSILYHFSPTDIYRIKGFPRKKYSLYIERLDFAVEGYFKGYVMNESNFGKDILNPKLKRI